MSNARPYYLTCKNQDHFIQTCTIDSKRNQIPHVRSNTLYQHLLPGKSDMRMTCCWSCKEQPVDNDQNSKPQSSHILSYKQHSSELHVIQNEQKVNK